VTNAVTSVHDKVINHGWLMLWLALDLITSLLQLPDSASVSVCTSTSVGQDVLLLCEQCGPILLCVWGSDVSVTEAFYNSSDQENVPSVLWV